MAEVISSERYCRIFAVLSVLILSVFTFSSGSSVHHGVPQLSITEPQTSVQKGDQLQITCKCNTEVQWDYPQHEFNNINLRLVVATTEKTNVDGEKDYTSVLTVENTTYLDTGIYRCRVKMSRELTNNQTAASVYVFVNSDESEELMIPAEKISFKMYATWSFTIPCRVTNPAASVTLKKGANRIPTDGETVRYDPTRGFIIKEGDPEYTGMITCIARLDDQVKRLSYILFYEANAPKPQPTIRSSKAESVVGEHFRVTCTVDAPLSVTMSFVWTYPGQNGASNSTVEIENDSQIINEPTKTYRRFLSELKVSGSTLADMGYYYCNASNYIGSNKVSTYVQILETGYLEVTPLKNQYVIEAPINSEAKVVFDVRSYPKSNFMWYKDGDPIYSRNSSFAIRKKDNQRRLVIIDVTLEHEGNYTLVGLNEYMSEPVEATIQLIVTVPPEISIQQNPVPSRTNPPLYLSKERYTLDCDVSGKPLPSVTWLWQPCSDLDECKKSFSNSNQWSPVPTPDMDAAPGFHYLDNTKSGRSSLYITAAVQPGWYRCIASSSAFSENATQDIEFKLTDVKDGLSISADPPSAIETLPVNITCQANKYAYRNIRWGQKGAENLTFDSPQDLTSSNMQIHEFTTEYSHVSVLSILASQQSDAGTYHCTITNRRKDTHDPETTSVTYDLQVNVVRRPSILRVLRPVRLLASKGTFELRCAASGIPGPAITWHKDGHVIENNDVSEVQGDTVMSTLTVRRITMFDTGVYACRAENQGGRVNTSAFVEVYEVPKVMVTPEHSYAHEKDNVSLRCVVSGNPRPQVAWTKKFNTTYFEAVPRHMYTVVNSGKYSVDSHLNLKMITKQHMGSYRCKAFNIKTGEDTYAGVDSDDGVVQVASNTLAQGAHANQLSEKQIQMMAVLGGAIALALIVFVVIIISLRKYRRRRYHHSDAKEMNFPPIIEDGVEVGVEGACEKIPYDEKWEFPEERLRIGQTIGRGAFGRVVKAAAWGINGSSAVTTVAVKMLKPDASESEKRALWMELKVLIHIGQHLNIVNLLGACTTDCLYLIIEYCKHGNLCDYLRTRRDSFVLEPRSPGTSPSDQDMYDDVFEYNEDPLSLHDLTCFCFQVARGMEFLSSKRVIHRDLAARNVLLSDNHVVKICDFGLARDIYDDPNYITKGSCRLPIKWMAPESILDDKVFTTQSDVWSFGVLMWEIFSLGGTPYPGMQIDEDFFQKMRNGYRMRCPELAPQELYQLMLQSWNAEAKARPSFSALAEKLGGHLESNVRQEYIDLNEPYRNRTSTILGYADLQNELVPEYQPLMSKHKNSVVQAKPGNVESDNRASRPYLEPITRRINGSAVTTFPASENDDDVEYIDGAADTELSSLTRSRASYNHKGSSKSEESVSSDLSSGFHSEGYANEHKHNSHESDAPPEYSQVVEAETNFSTLA